MRSVHESPRSRRDLLSAALAAVKSSRLDFSVARIAAIRAGKSFDKSDIEQKFTAHFFIAEPVKQVNNSHLGLGKFTAHNDFSSFGVLPYLYYTTSDVPKSGQLEIFFRNWAVLCGLTMICGFSEGKA